MKRTLSQSNQRRGRWAALFAAFALTAGVALPAVGGAAPVPTRSHGWFLGAYLLSDHMSAEDAGARNTPEDVFVQENGGGGLLTVGYAFTPGFALRLVAGGAAHETTRNGSEVNHVTATVEAVFRFLPGERARPYVFGGLGGADLKFTAGNLDSKVSGGAAVLGAGVVYRLTGHLGLDLGGRLDLINWDRVEVVADLPGGGTTRLENPVDDSGSAGKILLGAVWSF